MIEVSNNGIIIGNTNIINDIPKIKSSSKVFRHVGTMSASNILLNSSNFTYNAFSSSSSKNPIGQVYSLKLTVNGGSGSLIPIFQNRTIPLSSGLVYNYHADFIAGQGEIVSEYDILTYKYSNNSVSPQLEIRASTCATPRYTNGVFGNWDNFNSRVPAKSISFSYTLDVYTFN